MKRILFFILLFPTTVFTQQNPVFYNGSNKLEILYDQISFLGAGDSVLTLASAQNKYAEGAFIINRKRHLNLGIARDNYWVTFSVVNNSGEPADLILNLENPRLNEIEIHELKQNILEYYIQTGDEFPFTQRAIFNNQFSAPLQLKTVDTVQVFLYMKHRGNTLQVPISLYTKNAFLEITEFNYFIIGTTIGFLILTFFFSSFLFLNSGNRLFLFYSLYVLSISMWMLSTEGYGFQFLWPQHPEWATRFGPGFSVFNLCTFLMVGLEFTKPYDQTKWIRKLLWGVVGFTLLWGAFAFMPFISISNPAVTNYFLTVSFTIYLLSLFFTTGYLFFVSIKKNRIVLFYFFAVIVSISFTLLTVAKHSGFINLPFSSAIFMGMPIVFELILMTLGITKQFYRYKQEKEEMLIEYLDQQKEINRKILEVQEMERKRISKELHDDIGAGLTQIILIGNAAQKKHSTTEELQDIGQTANQLVVNMGEIIWSMTPGNNRAEDFFSYSREQLNKQLEYSGMEYSIDFPENVVEVEMTNEMRRNLLMVTKEIINNAIKYSNAQEIKIKAELLKRKLCIEIKDNGVGFDSSAASSGNGLKNIKKRVDEMGGELIIESSEEKGTHFTVNVTIF